MKSVNVHQAKTNLSRLLETLEKKRERVVICRNGKPVADLIPHKRERDLSPHPVLSKIEILYDPTEPATEEEWSKAYR